MFLKCFTHAVFDDVNIFLPVGAVGTRVEVGFCKTDNWKRHRCWPRSAWTGRTRVVGTAIVRRTAAGPSTRTERARTV